MTKAVFDNFKQSYSNDGVNFVRCLIPFEYEGLIEAYAHVNDGLIVQIATKLKRVRRGQAQFGSTIAIDCEARCTLDGNELFKHCNPIVFSIGEQGYAVRSFPKIDIPDDTVQDGFTLHLVLKVTLVNVIGIQLGRFGEVPTEERSTPINIGGASKRFANTLKELLFTYDETSALASVLSAGTLRLHDFAVFEGYYRFYAHDRAICNEIIAKGVALLAKEELDSRSMLIWSKSGMGKSSLIRSIAVNLGLDPKTAIKTVNCAECKSELDIINFIKSVEADSGTRIVLFDEADSHIRGKDVIYKHLMPFIELKSGGTSRWLSVMIGSTGNSAKDIAEAMHKRFKGDDLLGRIPDSNLVEIPIASFGDRMLAFCAGVLGEDRERVVNQSSILVGASISRDMRGAADLGARARLRAANGNKSIVNLIHVVETDIEYQNAFTALGDLIKLVGTNEVVVFH